MIAPGTMIEARLVRYIRNGILHAVKAGAWDIDDGTELPTDPAALRSAFACFDELRSLFEVIGFVDEPEQADLLVDLFRWPIVLRVVESQRDWVVRRLQDLAVDSFMEGSESLTRSHTRTEALR